jgi:hypothetical protein
MPTIRNTATSGIFSFLRKQAGEHADRKYRTENLHDMFGGFDGG